MTKILYKKLFDENKDQIAAVIVEPVAANMGLVLPEEGFLEFLREITKDHGSLLIFDEVITGFRLSLGGAQQYYNIKPDITTLGKNCWWRNADRCVWRKKRNHADDLSRWASLSGRNIVRKPSCNNGRN